MTRPGWRAAVTHAVAITVLLLAACGAPPTGPSASAPRAPDPDPNLPQYSVLSTQHSSSSPSPWQTEWEQTLAAARRQGKVVVSGGVGESYRASLTAFQRDHPEIQVEYSGLSIVNFWTRVYRERAAEQYLWDVKVGGPALQAYQAKSDGMLDPIRPLLLLPEVVDDSKWLGGIDGTFADRERQFMPAFTASASQSIFVNRDLVPEAELSSARQLLDPRWRGKIAIGDWQGGSSIGELTVLTVGYGEDFVTALLGSQELVSIADLRQLAEWVVRGRYPIVIGVPVTELARFKSEGMAPHVKPLAGPLQLSMAAGSVQLLNRAPHPEAARVYVNWLLTRKAQTIIAEATEYNSRRTDVPPADPSAVVDPANVDKYIAHQAEELLPFRARAQQLAETYLR
jgi:ABC-type Fe3+ transport system substrate-binding protein